MRRRGAVRPDERTARGNGLHGIDGAEHPAVVGAHRHTRRAVEGVDRALAEHSQTHAGAVCQLHDRGGLADPHPHLRGVERTRACQPLVRRHLRHAHVHHHDARGEPQHEEGSPADAEPAVEEGERVQGVIQRRNHSRLRVITRAPGPARRRRGRRADRRRTRRSCRAPSARGRTSARSPAARADRDRRAG